VSDTSVFIPSYNHAAFIERTLRSVFAQTLAPKKLLVIDDGSTDNSVEIIDKVLKDCPFENEFVARENRGLCATLNEGFANTSGEFFAYIGSDDVWFPAFLEQRIKLLNSRRDAVLAFGHSFLIDEYDSIVDSTADWLEYADGDMQMHLLKGLLFAAPSVVYRRSAVAKYNWNEDAKLEDYELYLKLSSEGDFAFDPNILCGWRQHQTNASKNLPVMFNEWIEAQNRVANLLRQRGGEFCPSRI
jgi:alpha-1,3-rhamnosyltransferase